MSIAKLLIILFLIFFLIPISACSSYIQVMPSPIPASPTESIISPATSTRTSTPTITQNLSPTTTLTATPTLHPIPTLSQQESEKYLIDFFRNPEICRFPCWLNVIPDTTTFTEFQSTIQHLGLRYAPKKFNTEIKQIVSLGGLDYESMLVLNRVDLLVEPNGVITGIEGVLHEFYNPGGFSSAWDILDIKQVLLEYGMPSSISIITDYNDVAGGVGYSIRVYYIDQGFAVYYGGGTDCQKVVNTCPHLKDFQLMTVAFSLQSISVIGSKQTISKVEYL